MVGVGRGEGLTEARANALGEAVATDLDDLQAFLDLKEKPPVFLVPSHEMDPDVFLLAKLPNADGVVVKAALASPALVDRDLRSYVVSRVLSWHSRGRLALEERRWLLDGFARRWRSEGTPGTREVARLAAAGLTDLPDDALERWYTTRERLGTCLSDSVAQEAVSVLAERLGPERFQAFAREALGVRPPRDVRALLAERRVPDLLAAHSAPTLAELVAEVRARIGAAKQADAAGFAQLSSLQPSRKEARVASASVEVRHALRSTDSARPPISYAFRYVQLGPWADEITPEFLGRIDAVGQGVMPFVVPVGTRLFTAFEVQDARLGCAVRLAAGRWEVQ